MHRYYADPDDPWELLWVRFGGFQTPYYFDLLQAAENPVIQTSSSEHLHQLFQQLYNLFRLRPPGLEFMASSLVTQVLTGLIMARQDMNKPEAVTQNPAYPEEIQLALEFIETHYHLDIKVEDVTQSVHLSPYYFSRLFKRHTYHTIIEYIIKYRLIISKQLLISTSKSIGEIAEHVGMCNQSYFSMIFKKHEGITPKEYRQYIRSSTNITKIH
jgi:YesN/AraC family two-component response regulator